MPKYWTSSKVADWDERLPYDWIKKAHNNAPMIRLCLMEVTDISSQ